MRNAFTFVIIIALILSLASHRSAVAQVRGVSSRDCAEVKYITRLWMNTAGTQVAFLVKSPNVERNVNEYQLYVKDVSDATPSNGNLLITGVEISDIQWIDNDRRIALLISIGGLKKLVSVDLKTGVSELIFPTEGAIDSFSMDAAGDTVAYSVQDPAIQNQDAPGLSNEQLADGYRISFEDTGNLVVEALGEVHTIYVRRRDARGTWSLPQTIAVENPFTHVKTTHLDRPQDLSMSPNGKKIALTYFTDGLPEDWANNPEVQIAKKNWTSFSLPVLFDVDSGRTALAFKMIYISSKPVWSRDSQSFFINSHSPIGSHWETEDIRDHLAGPGDANLFRVNVASGTVDEVIRHTIYDIGPLFLPSNGDVVVRGAGASVERLHESKDGWQEIDQVSLPKKAEDRFYQLTSNGEEIFGVHETVTAPDALFSYKAGQGQISVLTNLNAQWSALRAASVETVQWTTAEGLNVSGLLFVPPDYIPGRRYPLVIQTKPDSGWFNCDYGPGHFPSFAPQPIASAGIVYLARSDYGENFDQQAEIDKRPKGYPGGIAEAVQQMDIWDSAIDTLSKRGLIDESKIGIIGFSRTGLQVEFDLIHSQLHYAAATVTDNVQYSLGEYWLFPWSVNAADQMYGGPPYGRTLENWQKYSISFNLEKVHTPLLMEENGYGVQGELVNGMPTMLAAYLEITTGLRRLNKPMEMYYYPGEVHQVDHPKARLASMQRNVDWYRFWLQGYEDGDPSKKEQYKRWRALKALQEQDSASSVGATEPLPR